MSQTMFKKSLMAVAVAGVMTAGSAYAANSVDLHTDQTAQGESHPVAFGTNNILIGKTKLSVKMDGDDGLTDNFHWVAVTFNGGTAVEVIKSAGAGQLDAAQEIDLSGAATFDEVVIMALQANGGTETINGIAATNAVVVLNSDTTISVADLGTSLDDGAADLAIATQAATLRTSNAIAFDDYAGPKATAAYTTDKTSTTPANFKLQYNTQIITADADDNTTQSGGSVGDLTGLTTDPASANAADDGVTYFAAHVTAGADTNIVTVTDTGATAFDEAVTSFNFDPTVGNAATDATVFDLAGNEAVQQTGLNGIVVDNLPSPALLSTAGTQAAITSAISGLSAADEVALWDGTGVDATGKTITISVMFNADMNAATTNADDFKVSINGTDANIASVNDATSRVVEVAINGLTGTLTFDRATGKLQEDGNDVEVSLLVDAGDELQTALGGELSAASAAVDAFAGFDPSAPEVSTANTHNADGAGVVDGYTVNYVAPITVGTTSVFKLNSNTAIVDLGAANYSATADAAAGTVTVALNNTVTDAGKLDLDGNGTADEQADQDAAEDDLGTGDTAGNLALSAEAAAEDGNVFTYIWDAANSGAKMELPAIAQANNNISEDGVGPVIQAAAYAPETGEEYGSVTLTVSENVSLVAPFGNTTQDANNEIRFNDVPADILNLNANIGDRPVVTVTGDEIVITKIPGTVMNQTVSLGSTSLAEDTEENLLTVSPVAADNVVSEPALSAPELKSVKAVEINGTYQTVVATFDQAVEQPTGATATDLNGMFVVRVKVGADHAFGGSQTEYHQFVIAGSDVAIGMDGVNADPKSVTLTLPNAGVSGGLPTDTTEVWVDYEAATTAEIDNDGALNYLQNSNKDIAGGSDLYSGQTLANTAAAAVDADTAKVEYEFGTISNNSNLFNMTVLGSALEDGEAIPNGRAVRADVVRIRTITEEAVTARKAVVGNGEIEIRSIDDKETNTALNDAATLKQTVYLHNKAVTTTDLENYGKAVAAWNDAIEEQDEALANGNVSAAKNAFKKLETASAKLAADYGITRNIGDSYEDTAGRSGDLDVSSAGGTLNLIVELTTGNGKDAQSGSQGDGNGNAAVGHTATLVKSTDNKPENGTTYFAVQLSLNNGSLSNNNSDLGALSGDLNLTLPRLAQDAVETKYVEVLDTAFGRVDAGKYQLTVGMNEDELEKGDKSIDQKFSNTFVLVSAKDSDGDWALTNTAEETFTSYMPFVADLNSDGEPTAHNINLDNVAKGDISNASGWQLVGLEGVPARNAASAGKAVNMARLMITVDQTDGEPSTNWGYDGSEQDQAFSLAGNKMTLSYELGDNDVNGLVVEGGLAIAYDDQGPAAMEHGGASTQARRNLDDATGLKDIFIPTTGAAPVSDMKAGWSLITIQEDTTVSALAATHGNIDAVILLSGSTEAWFRGDSADSSTKLEAGSALFVHFATDTSGFTFK